MKKILSLVLLTVFFIACSKDEDDGGMASLDVTMANVAGNYRITAANLHANGTSVDIFNNDTFFEPCDRDDLYTFIDTGSYMIADVGITCNPANTQSGTYAITTSKKIKIDADSFSVVTLTSTKMVLQQPDFRSSGVTGTVTFTRQ